MGEEGPAAAGDSDWAALAAPEFVCARPGFNLMLHLGHGWAAGDLGLLWRRGGLWLWLWLWGWLWIRCWLDV